ncbi:hypothetical protein GCM10023322_09060 [Rugosimonospora acidiphila]|uniref:Uncharacterized protein n=1 Tax=Rugosimonospora acidiphila TaxID=556531 RepID=A0ABP9RLQ6_9ACTN
MTDGALAHVEDWLASRRSGVMPVLDVPGTCEATSAPGVPPIPPPAQSQGWAGRSGVMASRCVTASGCGSTLRPGQTARFYVRAE